MDAVLLSLLKGLTFSSEGLSLFLFVISAVLLLLFFRIGGKAGLFCFVNLAYITANIQVLHLVEFSFLDQPVALGTILFAMTFLATDILTEHYGPRSARQAVALSFVAQIGFTLLMLITVAHPPLPDVEGNQLVHSSMITLFVPAVRIMVASLIAYFVSQFFDIWVFNKISHMTHRRFLWLRTSIVTLSSALLDNIMFSMLAWVVFSPNPVGWKTLFITYILGTYGGRAIVSIASVPLMYLSYKLKPKEDSCV